MGGGRRNNENSRSDNDKAMFLNSSMELKKNNTLSNPYGALVPVSPQYKKGLGCTTELL
jgi:hypothetical protein